MIKVYQAQDAEEARLARKIFKRHFGSLAGGDTKYYTDTKKDGGHIEVAIWRTKEGFGKDAWGATVTESE